MMSGKPINRTRQNDADRIDWVEYRITRNAGLLWGFRSFAGVAPVHINKLGNLIARRREHPLLLNPILETPRKAHRHVPRPGRGHVSLPLSLR